MEVNEHFERLSLTYPYLGLGGCKMAFAYSSREKRDDRTYYYSS